MQNQNVATLITFIIMIALFYLIVFIPENKRKKRYNAMLESLKVNDEIMTKGGIIGEIVNIQEDFIILQSGPDKSRIKLDKNGIAFVIDTDSSDDEEK